MTARVLLSAMTREARGKPLTTEQRLTLQWLRAEARVEREVAKRVRIRKHLDSVREAFEGSASPGGRAV